MKPIRRSVRNSSVIMSALAIFLLVSCQKNDDKQEVAVARGPVDGRSAQPVPGSVPLSGYVYTSSTYAADFTDAAKGLMSASLPENLVCDVSPTNGIQIGGVVSFQGGTPQQAATPPGRRLDVVTSSVMRIKVTDSCVGQRDSNGQVIPALPELFFPQAQGYISGNYMNIIFSDRYGTIQIEGSFDRNEIIGSVKYRNNVSVPNGPGASGTLGDFRVPTCQFFKC